MYVFSIANVYKLPMKKLHHSLKTHRPNMLKRQSKSNRVSRYTNSSAHSLISLTRMLSSLSCKLNFQGQGNTLSEIMCT